MSTKDFDDITLEEALAMTHISEIATARREREAFRSTGFRGGQPHTEIANLKKMRLVQRFMQSNDPRAIPVINKLGLSRDEAAETLGTAFQGEVGHGHDMLRVQNLYYLAAEKVFEGEVSLPRIKNIMLEVSPADAPFLDDIFKGVESWIEYFKNEHLLFVQNRITDEVFSEHMELLNKDPDLLSPEDEQQIEDILNELRERIEEATKLSKAQYEEDLSMDP